MLPRGDANIEKPAAVTMERFFFFSSSCLCRVSSDFHRRVYNTGVVPVAARIIYHDERGVEDRRGVEEKGNEWEKKKKYIVRRNVELWFSSGRIGCAVPIVRRRRRRRVPGRGGGEIPEGRPIPDRAN